MLTPSADASLRLINIPKLQFAFLINAHRTHLTTFRIFVKNRAVNTVIIDNKSYVVLPVKNYEALQKKAALKTRPEKVLSIEEARAHSKKLIRKWAGEK